MLTGRRPPEEIQDYIRKGYLIRLESKATRLRKLLVRRAWGDLKVECSHLKNTACSFGFSALTNQAREVESFLIADSAQSKRAVENLIVSIDHLLVETRIKP